MKSAVAALAALLTLSTPAWADEITVETALGDANVPVMPETIAVLDMGALDILDAMGVEGVTSIQNILLDNLKAYEGDLGTLFEPDYEALNALSPDLIIAGGRSSAEVENLSSMATTIDMTMTGDDLMDQTRARIEAYGAIFDKADRAAEMIATLNAELEATEAAVADKGTALILMTNGGKVSAYGAGGRFGWLHKEVGLPEVIEGLADTDHGESISFEFIRETNPDWILVLDRTAAIGAEGESAQTTLDNALMQGTTAYQNNHIIYLNSGDIYLAGGGYQSTLATLKLLKDAFTATSS